MAKHKASQKSNNKKLLPPSSYNHLMGSPMDNSDHPVDNIQHPQGNSNNQGPSKGPMYVPGNLNPNSPGMAF